MSGEGAETECKESWKDMQMVVVYHIFYFYPIVFYPSWLISITN